MPCERLERATKRLADRELRSALQGDDEWDWPDCDCDDCCIGGDNWDALESLRARWPWSVTLGEAMRVA